MPAGNLRARVVVLVQELHTQVRRRHRADDVATPCWNCTEVWDSISRSLSTWIGTRAFQLARLVVR